VNRIHALCLVGLPFLWSVAFGGETSPPRYRCQGNQVTGFTVDKKTQRWVAARLPPKQYVIRAPERSPEAPLIGQDSVFVVVEVGDQDWSDTRFCKEDFDAAGELHCSGWGDEFHFNRATGRFLHVYAHGYIEGANNPYFAVEGETPPFLEIGRCEPEKPTPGRRE